MKETIQVDVHLSLSCEMSHIGITLLGRESKKHLTVDVAFKGADIASKEIYEYTVRDPHSCSHRVKTFDTEGDIEELKLLLDEKLIAAGNNFHLCTSNCADFARDILTKFFPEHFKSKPDSACHYVCCGLWLPTALQCCTLAGSVFERVMARERPDSETTPLLDAAAGCGAPK